MKSSNIKRLVVTAMLCAAAFALYLWEVPFSLGVSHLKIDFSDIPALIGGVFYGPLTAFIISIVKNIIQLLFRGIGTQMGFGNMMDVITGCAYTVTFSIIYKKLGSPKNGIAKSKSEDTKKKSRIKNNDNIALIIACISSTAMRVLIGLVANYFITPLFFKYFLSIELTKEVLWGAIGSASLLNLFKSVILSVVSFPVVLSIYKKVKKML